MSAALLAKDVQVVKLAGEQAGRSQLLNALDSAHLMHFSGHATSTGLAGLESGLALVGGDRLEVRDVLAMSRGPRIAVLMGCETGRVEGIYGSRMHLAAAFIVAGSQYVVATSQPVDDASAASFSAEFYRADSPTGPWDVGAMAQRSAAVLRSAGDPQWAAFRVWRR